MLWRFRGTPYYLTAQGERLGLSRVVTDRAWHNKEMHRASGLLGQLAERYHKAPKTAAIAMLPPNELAQVHGSLGQAEEELAKLHALAAAAQAMLDEAYPAFGLDRPDRPFRVQCDFDPPAPANTA